MLPRLQVAASSTEWTMGLGSLNVCVPGHIQCAEHRAGLQALMPAKAKGPAGWPQAVGCAPLSLEKASGPRGPSPPSIGLMCLARVRCPEEGEGGREDRRRRRKGGRGGGVLLPLIISTGRTCCAQTSCCRYGQRRWRWRPRRRRPRRPRPRPAFWP